MTMDFVFGWACGAGSTVGIVFLAEWWMARQRRTWQDKNLSRRYDEPVKRPRVHWDAWDSNSNANRDH